jgi:UDP-2,3-diacylglucosamine pyrophosphatase LpxH
MSNNAFRRKLNARTIFLSDLHLGSRGCRADLLLDFLDEFESDQLVLVGDVVDLESLRRSLYWPAQHMEVVRRILARARDGVRVIYVPGNHDASLREFVGSDFARIEVRHEFVHTTADGRRLLAIHGDEFDDLVHCSPWLSRIGTHAYDATLALSLALSAVRRRFGRSHWSLVGYLKAKIGNAMQYIESFERAAAHAARRRGLDGVICGHIHRPRIATIEGVLYCNDGDWVESCSALIEDRNGRLAVWHAAERAVAARDPVIAPALDRAA